MIASHDELLNQLLEVLVAGSDPESSPFAIARASAIAEAGLARSSQYVIGILVGISVTR